MSKNKRVKREGGKNIFSGIKVPNVLTSAVAVDYEKPRKHGYVARFEYRLSVPGNDAVLDALVLGNGICVLVTKKAIGKEILEITFENDFLDNANISGKWKKGAILVKAGSAVCTVRLVNSNTSPGAGAAASSSSGGVNTKCTSSNIMTFITPVGGRVLEVNSTIIDPESFNLLRSYEYDHMGHICIINPNTEIPRLDGPRNWDSLIQHLQQVNSLKGVCFAFMKGNCSKGDSCRFKHTASGMRQSQSFGIINAAAAASGSESEVAIRSCNVYSNTSGSSSSSSIGIQLSPVISNEIKDAVEDSLCDVHIKRQKTAT